MKDRNEMWKQSEDGSWHATNSRVLNWGQNEDGSWHAEYILAGKQYVDLECTFTLKELKRRLGDRGLKLDRKTRIPMP